jgi:hypothetical protein
MLPGMATADVDALIVGVGFSDLDATNQQCNNDRPYNGGAGRLEPDGCSAYWGGWFVSFKAKHGISADELSSIRGVRERRSGLARAQTLGETIAEIPMRHRFMDALRVFSDRGATVVAVVMAKGGLTRRPGRSHQSYWPRPQVAAGDGCGRDVGDRVRFGDYLQSLADEQNLLRREY